MKKAFLTILLLSVTPVLFADKQAPAPGHPDEPAAVVDARSLRGKILCGYQGWFRCPGDEAQRGWVHWSRTAERISPETLTFDLWPDVSDYPEKDRHPAPGFTYPGSEQACLFSSLSAAVVQRHFEWMRDYGIDGAWVQHFLVGMPGGPFPQEYESHMQVVNFARQAAHQTGRVWALSYDIAQMPVDQIYDVLTSDWKKLVDSGLIGDSRYLRQDGLPVVQIWSFACKNESQKMTVELGNRLVDFFQAPGPYKAYLVGGVDWPWRGNPDPQWQTLYRRLDALVPWNVGNRTIDESGASHASMQTWAEDKKECDRIGKLWIPVIYPGFSWDHLKQKPGGSTIFPRRGGQFLWEQFHELHQLGADSVFVAMFDEVDEGTAIFKVTSTPPTQAYFVGYEGLPSDWYLRLVGEGARRLRLKMSVPEQIPIKP